MLFSILLIEQSSGGSYNVLVREYTDPYWASSRSQYDKILQAHGANTRKFWLVEVDVVESQYSHCQLTSQANIFSYWLRELAIFSRIGFLSWPNMGPYTP